MQVTSTVCVRPKLYKIATKDEHIDKLLSCEGRAGVSTYSENISQRMHTHIETEAIGG